MHFRAIGGSYGAGFYNDGTNAYFLSTNAGPSSGVFNGFRPLYWNLGTGVLNLSGGGQAVNIFGPTSIFSSFSTSGAASIGASLFANGVIDSEGNITANGGRLRASFGAFASGDPNSATILNDFIFAGDAGGWWTRLPNGIIIQGGSLVLSTLATRVTFPIAFSSQVLTLNATEANANGDWAVGQPTLSAFTDTTMTLGSAEIVALTWTTNWIGAGGQGTYWFAIGI
jgi:hypothetical protein